METFNYHSTHHFGWGANTMSQGQVEPYWHTPIHINYWDFKYEKKNEASTYMYMPDHRLFYQLGDNVRASLAVSHRTSLLNLALPFTLAQIPSLTDRVETEPEINVI